MRGVLFRSTELGCKDIGKDPVPAARWGDPGDVPTILPPCVRTGRRVKPSSAYGQGFVRQSCGSLSSPLTRFRPARLACGLRSRPVGHAWNRAWRAVCVSIIRSIGEKLRFCLQNQLQLVRVSQKGLAMPLVNSSAIARIEWNEGTLTIWFHESGRYDYLNVPEDVYRAFLASRSKGSYYNDYIKDRY